VAKPTVEERFLAKVVKTAGCWWWDGALAQTGYGYFNMGPGIGTIPAHRASYLLFVGPIPEGLDVDHLCHNRDDTCPGDWDCFHRSCVRPDDLDPCTRLENFFRSHRFKANRTHCPQGHPYTPENTQRWGGGRKCLRCHAQRERERRARQRSA
jgi:hypothetical protein